MLGVPFGFVFQGCGIWFWFLRGERVWVFVWFLILFFSGFFFFCCFLLGCWCGFFFKDLKAGQVELRILEGKQRAKL